MTSSVGDCLPARLYAGPTTGPGYTYTAAGRLASRLWARGTNTTYSYNTAGDPSGITYNDGATPTLNFGYDRRGKGIQAAHHKRQRLLCFDL